MIYRLLIVVISAYLFIGIINVYADNTEENTVAFKLGLYYGDLNPVLDENNVDVSKPLILKITIINNYNKWIKISNFGWGISCNYKGEKAECYSRDLYKDIEIFVPPKRENEVFIILDKYNNLDPKQKVGRWTIEYRPSISYNTICFEDITLKK